MGLIGPALCHPASSFFWSFSSCHFDKSKSGRYALPQTLQSMERPNQTSNLQNSHSVECFGNLRKKWLVTWKILPCLRNRFTGYQQVPQSSGAIGSALPPQQVPFSSHDLSLVLASPRHQEKPINNIEPKGCFPSFRAVFLQHKNKELYKSVAKTLLVRSQLGLWVKHFFNASSCWHISPIGT